MEKGTTRLIRRLLDRRRDPDDLRPIRRGTARRYLGRLYYKGRRYLLWASGRIRFAREQRNDRLPCLHASHESPLIRVLKDVDMIYQYNKITNLRIAAARLDGLVIRPGETLSFWRRVGPPVARRGFIQGFELNCGAVKPSIGGGLCQISNLLYWMTLHTDLTVAERYRHSYDVFPDVNRTMPFGSGATCVYPYRDLMVRNDTGADFQLSLRVGDENLEGEWRSSSPPVNVYRVVERGHEMRREYWGGFSRHNELYRLRFDPDGTFLDEEYVTENHAVMMYAPFLDDEPGAAGAADYSSDIR